jgi:lysophospholipase L1-like esterase
MIAAICLTLALVENTALVPVARTDQGWVDRHAAQMKSAKSGEKFELALIGDSITHGWGGMPLPGENWKGQDPEGYDSLFGPYKPINLGISGDRTQHVLYRLDAGVMDGMNPKGCMVMIGTNNMGSNTEAEIAEGVEAVILKIHEKAPKAKILLCSILPREWENGPVRKKVKATNDILAKMKWGDYVSYVPCWDGFLNEDNRMIEGLMPDQLHPNKAGYGVWAEMIRPTLRKIMGS